MSARSRPCGTSLLRGRSAIPADEQNYPPSAQFEGPLWQLRHAASPLHLLVRNYTELAAVPARAAGCARIEDLLQALPGAGALHLGSAQRGADPASAVAARCRASRGLLDMPTLQLPGDHDMPRVQEGDFGASERFAVSPGTRSRRYLQLPGGPERSSALALLPGGLLGWAHGRAVPLLPGAAKHTLTLAPR